MTVIESKSWSREVSLTHLPQKNDFVSVFSHGKLEDRLKVKEVEFQFDRNGKQGSMRQRKIVIRVD